MITTQLLPKSLKLRKLIFILPLLVIPGIFIAFHVLEGEANGKNDPVDGQITGYNTTLPPALFDDKENSMTKLAFYKKTDDDSVKKKQSLELDPYHDSLKHSSSLKVIGSSGNSSLSTGIAPAENPKVEELLKKLEQIKQSVRKPQSAPPPEAPTLVRLQQVLQGEQRLQGHAADTTPPDPQLERLNKMLDKVIRIQQTHAAEAAGASTVEDTGSNRTDTSSAAPPPNTISAVVEEDQTLFSGATIALRLTEEVTIDGSRIPSNQLVYGLASINNDRMLITIHSIRHDQSIYSTAMQVYDMDGLPGIHIPDMLSRDVAKQSADQGIGSMNLATFSPSIGAQAANAGIQATKSLLSRKIRLVRVSVPGGYRVLLRNMKGSGVSMVSNAPALSGTAPDSTQSPTAETFTPFLHRSVSEGKVALILQGVYLRDGLLWLSFRLKNQSPVGYHPEYTRCLIRERKKMKRMAVQEIPLLPVAGQLPPVVTGGTEQIMNLGFRPFTLSKDKKLMLQVAEWDGARELNLSISSKILLKAK